MFVEGGDRGFECDAVDADLVRELADTVGHGHPCRSRLPGEHGKDARRVAHSLIEDHPARAFVRESVVRRVVLTERLREIVVRHRLVGEALATAIDHQRTRRPAPPFELRHQVAVTADLGVEHRGLPKVGRHVRELRAGLHCHHQAVAGVVRWRKRLDLISDERFDHLAVPLVATAREDHTFARADQDAFAACFGADANNPAIDHDQLTRGCLEENLDATIKKSLEQHGDECGALGADVERFTSRQFGLQLVGLRSEILGEHRVGTERHQRAPRDQTVAPCRYLGANRVRQWLARTPSPLLTGHVVRKEVVREVRDGLHAQRRVRLEIGQHLGRCVDEGLEDRGIVLVTAREPLKVRECFLARIGYADFGHVVVAGQPRDATRHRSSAADHVGLFEYEYLGAAVVRHRGCGERGAAAADHDRVDDSIPTFGCIGQHSHSPALNSVPGVCPQKRSWSSAAAIARLRLDQTAEA